MRAEKSCNGHILRGTVYAGKDLVASQSSLGRHAFDEPVISTNDTSNMGSVAIAVLGIWRIAGKIPATINFEARAKATTKSRMRVVDAAVLFPNRSQ